MMKFWASKHIGAALLVALLCTVVLSGCQRGRFQVGGISYERADSGACVVAMEDGSYAGDVNIPDTVTFDGQRLPVVAIDAEAFQGCAQLHSLAIPATVHTIADGALTGCTGLRALHMGHAVPLHVDSALLADVPDGQCNLWVPLQSATAYQADVVWKRFTIFEEGAVQPGDTAAQHVQPVATDDHGE